MGAVVLIGDRQSKIGNVGTHPLPRTLLTSSHLVAPNQSDIINHAFPRLSRASCGCDTL